METLHNFYRNSLKALALLVIAAAALLRTYVDPLVAGAFPSAQLRSIESLLLGGLFLGGEWLLRRKVWKLVYPRLDFEGWWLGRTTYAAADGRVGKHPPDPIHHEVYIDQSCISIAILPTGTEHEFANWQSVAMNVLDSGSIGYAYRVRYHSQPGFPPEATGYEEMSVLEPRDKSLLHRNRPLHLSGGFGHADLGQTPVYRGTAEFVRNFKHDRKDARDLKRRFRDYRRQFGFGKGHQSRARRAP